MALPTATAPQSQNQRQIVQNEEYYNIQIHSSSYNSESYQTLHNTNHNTNHNNNNNQNTILYGKV